ncbi:MAG TPA: L-lactate permease [Anaerolineae bacterium]|nr:L-lactate permease [Anaerolineae bacterium]
MQAQIEVSLLLWLVALLPLAAILVLLLGLRWKAATAAPIGYFLAVLAAFLVFDTSAQNVALQTAKGMWDAVFILYVIVPALLLYQVSRQAGAFDRLRRGIERYTPNNLLHILAFGWVFASFLQGITGFGAPIAVTAPLLVAVGVRPLWAVVLPLIGHAWANTFGTLAVAWEGLELVTAMPDPAQTAILTAVMLLVGNLLAGFFIAWLYGRLDGVREALPAVLIIAAIQGLGQLLLAPLVPTLAAFVPATLSVGAVLLLARTGWYKGPSQVKESQVMEAGEQEAQGKEERESQAQEAAGGKGTGEQMPLWMAFAPYIVLIALIVLVLLIPPVTDFLEQFEIGLPFPRLETGMGVVTEAEEAYSAFSPLTHPGTFLLVATIVAYLIFKTQGYIKGTKIDDVLVDSIKTSIPSAMALFALVPLAKVMEGSGQILELALGIASVATGPVYAFLAPLVGSIGSFMTSSNLSSNILFGSLQESTADALGITTVVTLAGQTAGAALANSIAPGNVLLGIGAVGLAGKTGEVISKTIFYTLAAVVLAGIVGELALLFFFGG